MSAHFTYKESPSGSDLEQGDILFLHGDLCQIIQTHYPVQAFKDGCCLLVLTQTCDLVRRKGPCKTPIVTLAIAKPLEEIIVEKIHEGQHFEIKHNSFLCNDKYRQKISDFITKLFNNNEPDYFYLHEDQKLGIKKSYVAILRKSFIFEIVGTDFYEKLLEARSATLADVFKAKLGWLSGHLFSRVGTLDWTNHFSEDEFKVIVDTVLDKYIDWYPTAKESIVEKLVEEEKFESNDGLLAAIDEYEILKPKDIAIKRLAEILREYERSVSADISKRLLKKIENDPILSAILSRSKYLSAQKKG